VALKSDMVEYSRARDFEKALAIKKRLQAFTSLQTPRGASFQPVFGELEELRDILGMKRTPVAIECFDISNTGRDLAVGAMVKFVAGQPKKADYRKFRIKTVEGVDDFSMIREVVRRRYSRLLEESGAMPDLVLIDGGKAHLASAKAELDSLGLTGLSAASIAKEYNHVYTPGARFPVRLSPGSRALLLIQRIRDEAHRFAITYHRKIRGKKAVETGLRRIKGIGPAKEKALIEKAGGIGNLRRLSAAKLALLGVDKKTAVAVAEYFKKTKD